MPPQRSWVDVAVDSHFPIQNLPLGVIRFRERSQTLAARIGDYVLDCEVLRLGGLLGGDFDRPLSDITSLTGAQGRNLRARIRDLLGIDCYDLRDSDLSYQALHSIGEVEVLMPCRVPAFVDFYSGIHHASNVGRMFRPDMPPLLPNYRHLPVGYNGRASSLRVSGGKIGRPNGQTLPKDATEPVFGPTPELDFELEVGFIVSDGNDAGRPISVDEAESWMQGLVLVNDWSARDVQRWEYQPLGPFLAKSFATSISPWVVGLEVLEPFRVPSDQNPPPLEHLGGRHVHQYDLNLEVSIQTPRMKQPQMISNSNARHLYWSFAQQLAHQTSNGTPVEAGDLYASGTISGPEISAAGSLLELTWRGTKPILLEETGETRMFLEDGDRVTMSGYAQGDGFRIGFGSLTGEVTA
jgi:fumarylacetoacetase